MVLLLLVSCHSGTVSLPGGHTGSTDDSAVDSAADDSPTEIGGHFDCGVSGGPVYGVEDQALSVTVTCSSGLVPERVTVEAVPDGATWDTTSATLSWTPGLDQAGRYDLDVLVEGEGGYDTGTVTVWVADAWDVEGNVAVDPLTYTEEYGLPVVHLTKPPATNPDSEVTTELIYRGHTYTIGLEYRGAASLYYPKNSYRMSFPADDEFDDDDLGIPNRRTMVLTSTFDDPTYIRQKLSFDTWDALRPERRQVATALVVVYINGEYEGLDLLGDHIDKEWWEDQGWTEDGNLYKSVDHSASWYYDYATGWEKKDGEPADDFSDLTELLSWVVHSDDAEFRSGLDARIPVADIADWWVMCVGAYIDDSCGKNAYFYHDAATDDQFHHVPWDFNASFGQEWETSKVDPQTDWDFGGTNNLFYRSLQDTDGLGLTLTDTLHDALSGPMSATEQDARIDAYEAAIAPSVARDWARWGGSFQGYFGWTEGDDTPDVELAYLRSWIQKRDAFLASRYP